MLIAEGLFFRKLRTRLGQAYFSLCGIESRETPAAASLPISKYSIEPAGLKRNAPLARAIAYSLRHTKFFNFGPV